MPEPYFIYNDVSSKDMGILVNELPPIIKINRNINKVEVPGRDGFLTEDYGTYSGSVKSCECTLLDITKVDQVLMWLDGSGEVVFSNQQDRKYQVSIINQIPFSRIIEQWYKFVVIFDCQPFAHTIDNDVMSFSSPGTFYGAGTYTSKPVIKVYGTGTIDLTINSKTVHLTNVNGYVTVDSELMDCYKDTVLQNSNMIGEFPELLPVENVISWIGTVTRVDITPNWRWL